MMRRLLALAYALALLGCCLGAAFAATQYPTGTAGDSSVGTVVDGYVGNGGNATPVAPATPLPVGACTCTPVTPSQNNVSIASATGLTVPTGATYAVVQAVGGPAYYTYDGSTPTASNFSGYLAQGQPLTLSGATVLSAFKIFGTAMAVSYFK